MLPNAGPGLCRRGRPGRDAVRIAEGLAEGELSALYLLHSDPLRRASRPRDVGAGAGPSASTVVAHAGFLTEGIRDHADVVFPSEVYAEKDGTIVHPDGRIQRLRPAIARAGAARAESKRDRRARRAARARPRGGEREGGLRQLFEAVPFYAG